MRVEITYWTKAPLRPGDTADLPDAVAQALIRDNHAKPADGAADTDTPAPAPGQTVESPAAETDDDGKKARRGRLPVPPRPDSTPDAE